MDSKEQTKESFNKNIYALLALVPSGFVVSYGQLAVLAGRPRGARQVGSALRLAGAELPCHRVLNSRGRLAPAFERQGELLRSEGVTFLENGCVDMHRHRLSAEALWGLFLQAREESS